MDIKQVVDRVRSKLTDEQLSEVSTDLETIKSGYLEKVDEAKVAVDESVKRKLKIRGMTTDLENITIERDEWKTKVDSFDDTELIKERDIFKTKYEESLKTQVGSISSFIDKVKEHPNFEKAKGRFKFPEIVEDKFNWDASTPEDTAHNVAAKNDLEQLDYFAPTDKTIPPIDKSGQRGSDKSFEEALAAAKSSKEIDEVVKAYGVAN